MCELQVGQYSDFRNRITTLVHIVPSNKIVNTTALFFNKMSEYYSVSQFLCRVLVGTFHLFQKFTKISIAVLHALILRAMLLGAMLFQVANQENLHNVDLYLLSAALR